MCVFPILQQFLFYFSDYSVEHPFTSFIDCLWMFPRVNCKPRGCLDFKGSFYFTESKCLFLSSLINRTKWMWWILAVLQWTRSIRRSSRWSTDLFKRWLDFCWYGRYSMEVLRSYMYVLNAKRFPATSLILVNGPFLSFHYSTHS